MYNSTQPRIEEFQQLQATYYHQLENIRNLQTYISLPYDMLKAKYLMDVLQTTQEHGTCLLPFHNGTEAVQLIHSILEFKEKIPHILSEAQALQEVFQTERQLNQLIDANPYLSNHQHIELDETMNELVDKCLAELPAYSSYVSKAFYKFFIEACLTQLPYQELLLLVEHNILNEKVFHYITPDKNPTYNQNYQYIASYLGLSEQVTSQKTTVKGTTYNNDDETSRQQYLEQMHKYMLKGNKPHLHLEFYDYLDPKTNQASPAAKVMWGKKQIGVLSAELMKQLSPYDTQHSYIVDLIQVKGGNGYNYGCDITLHDVMHVSYEPIVQVNEPNLG